MERFLYEKLDVSREIGAIKEIPNFLKQGLSKRIELREYQKEAFENFITYFENEKLNKKGVNVRIVKESNTRILVYVYRKDKLIDEWAKPGVKSFMEKRGYGDLSVDMAIDKLSDKLMKNEGFPHEIGMFLGYPLGDVIGFIANSGKNSKCTGCWKVYCDECNAKKKFAQFDKCKKVYKNLWNSGKGLMQLAVSA